ncbi:MAG: hypothetical protein QXK42_01735 [Candidatus Korarchaeum sp.]
MKRDGFWQFWRRFLKDISEDEEMEDEGVEDLIAFEISGDFAVITIEPNGKIMVSGGYNLKEDPVPELINPLDVLIDGENVRVIAEVPGVKEDEIIVKATECSVTIDVRDEKKKVDLPVRVNPKNMRIKYKNGILEVILTKNGS